ncbi:MAG: DUF2974 domain-containing protein [Oscillospiraceae bacterium]|nr:DUF2974 domain-containing protein [Oscillospiraceae bacterium]
MANCFEYLDWRGDIPLSAAPLNEIDGMILSRISYAPFELVGKKKAVRLGDICRELLTFENLGEKLVSRDDEKLISAVSENPRFSGLYMFEYVNNIDTSEETQFSAVTFEIGRGLYYIAFRGTDDTLVGWKEDFNMSFVTPVPAQELAVRYFERVARKLRGKFILGGHSKGGNLAVYAAAFSNPRLQNRIIAVENFDGPGFDGEVLKKEGYKNIRERINTYIPQSSVVGLLLFHESEYTIVKSTYNGLLQHDTYSWEVERDKFVYLEKITEQSRFLDSALKEWIAGMEKEKREKLVDTLFEIISSTGAETVSELSENRMSNALSAIKALRGLDDETRGVLTEAISALLRGGKKVLSETIRNK